MIFNKLSIVMLCAVACNQGAAADASFQGGGLRATVTTPSIVGATTIGMKEPSEQQPKVAAMRVTPSNKLKRRLVAGHLRKTRRGLMETFVDAIEGTMDYSLDEVGREFLGYTPAMDVSAAVERYEDHKETIYVEVESSDGEFYTETVLFDNMHKHQESANVALGDEAEEDEDGGRRRRQLASLGDTIHYDGIYLEEFPNQEFQVVCAAESTVGQGLPDCEVYSKGLFVPPPENERRRLTSHWSILSSNQCVPAGQEDDEKYQLALEEGYSCPDNLSCEAPNYIANPSVCEQCTKDSDCSFLFEEGGVYYGKTWYYHNLNDDDYIIYNTVGLGTNDKGNDFTVKCGSGNRCIAYELEEDLSSTGCFSGSSVVSTPLGTKRMSDLQVNDHVLTASGKFEPVYAFQHRVPIGVLPSSGGYIRIITEHGSALDLTNKHMIYLNGNHEYPVEASKVKVGDSVTLLKSGMEKKVDSKVVEVRSAFGRGAFSPQTKSGTIVVDGIIASTFSNPLYMETEYVLGSVLHISTFLKWLTSPVYVYCTILDESVCAIDNDKESFFPMYESATKLVMAAKEWGLDGILMAGVALFSVSFYVLEQTAYTLVSYGCLALVALLALGWFVSSSPQVPKKGRKQL